jgi:hypothetical protein
VGQKAFGYFALFKVTRRKGGTLSSRYRINGYVHKQDQKIAASFLSTAFTEERCSAP